ncbi:hypothetical protein ACFO3J_26025 [Streptomyces polygonati]|uniref:Uncharacterized protein n=1 Tax=Streptomyces polygonati TaxID=1617087 RepID=A0ABV8HVH7_9ACTN
MTRWLGERGFPAVRPLPMAQPVQVEERAASFWPRPWGWAAVG